MTRFIVALNQTEPGSEDEDARVPEY